MSEEKRRTVERLAPPLEVVLLDDIFRLQKDILEGINKLVKFERDTLPRGIPLSLDTSVSFGAISYFDFVNEKPFHRLVKVEIINDGPNDVVATVKVQDENPYEVEVEAEEVIPIETKTPRIERVDIRVRSSGDTATVRVVGLY